MQGHTLARHPLPGFWTAFLIKSAVLLKFKSGSISKIFV